MYCSKCGKENNDNANFCGSCGNPINKVPETQAAKIDMEASENDFITLSEEEWKPLKGEEKSFTLCGKQLIITAEMDLSNAYRLKIMHLAKKCSDNALSEYKSKVNDLYSFFESFMQIFDKHLEIIINKVIGILTAENISVSYDSFLVEHSKSFHLAKDFYDALKKGYEGTINNNQQATDSVMGFAGNLLSRKTKSQFLDGFIKGVTEEMSKPELSQEQLAELYGRIKLHELFNRVYLDYFNVYATLVTILHNNSISIYFPAKKNQEEANEIFQNMSNENFSQDKLIDTYFEIIKLYPFENNYHKFISDRLIDSDEVKKITDYFGVSDSINNIYNESKFIKFTKKRVQTETAEQNDSSNGEKKKMDVKKLFKIAAGAAVVGAALNGFGKSSNNDNGKKDLMGSAGCVYGKKGRDGWTQTCASCPLRSYCTRS